MTDPAPRDPRYHPSWCNTFWGSHGCDLPYQHQPPCVCGFHDPDGRCSQYEPGVGVRFYHYTEPVSGVDEAVEASELYGFGQPWGDAALPQPPLPTDNPPHGHPSHVCNPVCDSKETG